MVFVGGQRAEINEYESLITDVVIKKRCIFVERQEADMVPLYQRAIDILVLPAPNRPPFNNYLLPMKIYEYLASRKPIVYSKLEILDEVLEDCAYGFVPDNFKDLSMAIMSITNGPSRNIDEKVSICYSKAVSASWHMRAKNIIDWLKLS